MRQKISKQCHVLRVVARLEQVLQSFSKNGPFELVDINVVKKLCPILRSRKLHFKSNTCILKKGEQKDKKCELLKENITEQNSECTSISPCL